MFIKDKAELYKFSKEIEYDNDWAVLFYKDKKIAKNTVEGFSEGWSEEFAYVNTIKELLNNVGIEVDLDLESEDNLEPWYDIWSNLTYDYSSHSYKYGNWELMVLDI